MTKAIRIHANGGPEAMRWEEIALAMRGALKVEIGRTYALKDATTTHRDFEARKSAESMLLMP